jgi:hypothetical protein
MEVMQPASDPLIHRCLQALYPDAGSNASSCTSSRENPSAASAAVAAAGGGSSSSMVRWFQQVLGLPDAAGDPSNVWLPTRCLQLLELLHAVLPHHTLIAADFDSLPDVKVSGKNAPLVSGRTMPGVGLDYDTAMVPWGSADIFFPTNFNDLGTLYHAAAAAGAASGAASGAGAGDINTSAWPAFDRPAATQEELQQLQQLARHGQSLPPRQQQQQQQQQHCQIHCSHASTGEFMSAFPDAKRTRTLSGYNPLVQDWVNTRVFFGQRRMHDTEAAGY